MAEFIFTMQEVTRIHPPDKRVLENINLSFFFGAKIGVLGANGSGKSSLLRIMAGVDKEFLGEAAKARLEIDGPLGGARVQEMVAELYRASPERIRQASICSIRVALSK